MQGAALFFLLVPSIFIAFAIALGIIAAIERGQHSARWAAAGFLSAGLAMILDVYRDVDDDVLSYVAVLLHFASVSTMMQAFTLRHRVSLPRWVLAMLIVAALWLLPGTDWRPDVAMRRIIVHAAMTATLFVGLLKIWRFRRDSVIDVAITMIIAASLLSYISRTAIPIFDPPTAESVRADRLEQNYVVFAHMTSAVLGFAAAILLMLAVGQDLLRWRTREARTDQLTGIGNRRQMLRIITADRLGTRPIGGVVAIDLDHFKQVNDRYGHAAGDQLLAQVGAMLLGKFGHLGTACRVGGEEFILFLDAPLEASLKATAEEVRQSIETMPLGDPLADYDPTASLGYCAHEPGNDMEATLRKADRAIYAAKAGGRNRVERCP